MSSGVTAQPVLRLNNGREIPQFGLGTLMNTITPDDESVIKMIEAAVEIGYRHFDTAQVYGNERAIGIALQKCINKDLVKREELFITTKLWRTNYSHEDIIPSLKKSLERLNLSYVDLFLMHWPNAFKSSAEYFPKDERGKIAYDESIDYVDVWKGLEDCVDQGLTKSIGVSNFNRKQLQRVLDKCRIPPAVNQFESHPYLNNEQLIQFCKEKGVTVCVYAPLGGNWAKVQRESHPVLYADTTLQEIARKHNCTVAQVALAYQMKRDVVVLPKTEKRERLQENWKALNVQLIDEDMRLIRTLDRSLRIYDEFPDHVHYPFNED